jgi:hypothetical protein
LILYGLRKALIFNSNAIIVQSMWWTFLKKNSTRYFSSQGIWGVNSVMLTGMFQLRGERKAAKFLHAPWMERMMRWAPFLRLQQLQGPTLWLWLWVWNWPGFTQPLLPRSYPTEKVPSWTLTVCHMELLRGLS